MMTLHTKNCQACVEYSITQIYGGLSKQHKLQISSRTTVMSFPISYLFLKGKSVIGQKLQWRITPSK